MSDAISRPDANGGRCEGCDGPETVGMPQELHPVTLGGGIGPGKMWLCLKCVEARRERDKVKKLPVEPVDHSLLTCPHCEGQFQRAPYMPEIILPIDPAMKLVTAVFEFKCPYCDEMIHLTMPSERKKAPVIPLRRKT